MKLNRSGHLDIKLALDLSLYLVNEVEYVPWQIALASLGYIDNLLEGNPDYSYFRVRHCVSRQKTVLISERIEKLSLSL